MARLLFRHLEDHRIDEVAINVCLAFVFLGVRIEDPCDGDDGSFSWEFLRVFPLFPEDELEILGAAQSAIHDGAGVEVIAFPSGRVDGELAFDLHCLAAIILDVVGDIPGFGEGGGLRINGDIDVDFVVVPAIDGTGRGL